MATIPKERNITCVGISLFEPILKLYTELNNFKFTGESRIRVSMRENGYSASIIVLSVLLIESALNRVRYLEGQNEGKSNLVFFEKQFKNQKLSTKLKEIYVLRDLIVHNHLWEVSYEYDENFNEKNIEWKKLSSYEDPKYTQHVDKTNQCTKTLKLSIIPTKVGINDVKTVFSVMGDLLSFLNEQDSSYFPILNYYFEYEGKQLKFRDILDQIIS